MNARFASQADAGDGSFSVGYQVLDADDHFNPDPSEASTDQITFVLF